MYLSSRWLNMTDILGLVKWNSAFIGWRNIILLSIFEYCLHPYEFFVCVEVLRPSQPNGFMSVSLPNHTFTGQVWPFKRFTSTWAHSFTRNWQISFLNQQKGEYDHWKYFMINLHESFAGPSRNWPYDFMITTQTCILLSHKDQLLGEGMSLLSIFKYCLHHHKHFWQVLLFHHICFV